MIKKFLTLCWFFQRPTFETRITIIIRKFLTNYMASLSKKLEMG